MDNQELKKLFHSDSSPNLEKIKHDKSKKQQQDDAKKPTARFNHENQESKFSTFNKDKSFDNNSPVSPLNKYESTEYLVPRL